MLGENVGGVGHAALSATLIRLLLAGAMVVAAPPLGAMESVSADADATVTIIRALEINQLRDLGFGDIIAGTTGGTVTVSPDSGVQSTGSVTYLGGNQSAQFAVFGEVGQSFTISLPAGPISVSSGASTMQVGIWTSNPIGGDTIPPSGRVELFVGATLTVAGNQPPGLYQGIFTVSVAYD